MTFDKLWIFAVVAALAWMAGLALSAFPPSRWWKLRGRRLKIGDRPMTKFEREIIEARMTADDELEYDRIMRAIGHTGEPPLTTNPDSMELELRGRLRRDEITLAQFDAELANINLVRARDPRGIAGPCGECHIRVVCDLCGRKPL